MTQGFANLLQIDDDFKEAIAQNSIEDLHRILNVDLIGGLKISPAVKGDELFRLANSSEKSPLLELILQHDIQSHPSQKIPRADKGWALFIASAWGYADAVRLLLLYDLDAANPIKLHANEKEAAFGIANENAHMDVLNQFYYFYPQKRPAPILVIPRAYIPLHEGNKEKIRSSPIKLTATSIIEKPQI